MRSGSEVKEQTDFILRCFQIVQQLGFVIAVNGSGTLQFDNHAIVYNQVGAKLSHDFSPKANFHCIFAPDSQTSLSECYDHCLTIDRLQEAVTQFVVYVVEGANNCIGQPCMFEVFALASKFHS